MKCTIAHDTRAGKRPYNQDRLGYWRTPEAVLMVLADGMGGHAHGEVAAELTMRHIAAAAPQPADERLEKDLVVPARRAWSGKYSAELLDTVDWCLRMYHLERPQSVFALQKALTGEKEPEHRGKAPLLDRMRGMLRRG